MRCFSIRPVLNRRISPSNEAIKFAEDGKFDGFVAVGGGSSMDTAKAANLYSTYPADLMTYVNPPIGKGTPIPGPLKPLMAVPTTAGTGSETTGVAIFDYLEMNAKTGIAHRALRPVKGLIDPNNTRSLPKMVAACTGLDQLTHALEAMTALPYNQRPAPEHPKMRPAYQGANPISDIWASRAIEMIAKNLVRVIEDPSDDAARGEILLPPPTPGSDSATAVSIWPTACPILYRERFASMCPKAIPPATRSYPTAWPSSCMRLPCSGLPLLLTRSCIYMPHG